MGAGNGSGVVIQTIRGVPSAAPNLGACCFQDRYQLRPPIPPHHDLRGAVNVSHLVTIFGKSNLIRISTDMVRTLPCYGPGC